MSEKKFNKEDATKIFTYIKKQYLNNEFQEIDITRFLKMLLELSEETKVFDRLIISLFNMLSE